MATVDMTERALQDAVVELARLTGWLVYHTYDSRRSEPGFPDLVLVRETRVVWAELRSENGRVTPAQKKWLESLDRAGQEVYIWYPKDWHDGLVELVLMPDPVPGQAIQGRTMPDIIVCPDRPGWG